MEEFQGTELSHLLGHRRGFARSPMEERESKFH